jgi:hypothetical protein
MAIAITSTLRHHDLEHGDGPPLPVPWWRTFSSRAETHRQHERTRRGGLYVRDWCVCVGDTTKSRFHGVGEHMGVRVVIAIHSCKKSINSRCTSLLREYNQMVRKRFAKRARMCVASLAWLLLLS